MSGFKNQMVRDVVIKGVQVAANRIPPDMGKRKVFLPVIAGEISRAQGKRQPFYTQTQRGARAYIARESGLSKYQVDIAHARFDLGCAEQAGRAVSYLEEV